MPRPRKRALLWVAAGALALPVLVVAALYLPPVQRLLVSRALDAVRASGLDVQVGQVSFSPARLALTAEDVRVAAIDHPDAPLLEARRLDVDVARTILMSRGQDIAIEQLSLTSPRILLRRDARGRWNLPPDDPSAEPTPLPHLTLRDVAITDARIVVDDQITGQQVVLRDLSLTSAADVIEVQGALDATVGGEPLAGRIDAAVTYDGDVLGIRRATLRSGGSTAQVEGDVDVRSGRITLTSTLHLAAADAAALVALPDARGTLDARVEISGNAEEPLRATWALEGRRLSDGQAPPLDLDAKGNADASRVVVDTLQAHMAGGRLTIADAVVALAEGETTRLSADVERLPLRPLLDAYAPGVPVTAGVDATLRAEGPGLDWTIWRTSLRARLSAPGSVRADDLPLEGVVTARAADGRWTADGSVAVPDAVMAAIDLEGTLATPVEASRLAGTLRLEVDDLAAALSRVAAPDADIAGRATLDARVSGTVGAPAATWTLDGTLTPTPLAPTQLAASGRASLEALVVESLEAVAAGNRLEGSLTARLNGQQVLTGRIRGTLPAIGAWLPADATGGWPLTGAAALDATVAGTISAPAVDARVEARDLALAGQRVDSLAGRVRWRDTTVRVTELEARSGNGSIAGQVEADLSRATHSARLSIDGWPVEPVPAATSAPTPARADGPADRLPADTPAPDAPTLPLRATLDAAIDTRGPWTQPSGTATLDFSDVTWDGQPLGSAAARLEADGRMVAATFAAPDLTTTGKGTLTFTGARPFDVEARIDGLTLAPFRPWLPAAWTDARAVLTATVAATGSADAPAETLRLDTRLDRFAAGLGTADVTLAAPARISASRDAVAVAGLSLRSADLVLDVEGALARSAPASDPLSVSLRGNLSSLQPWADAAALGLPPVQGDVQVQLQVGGSLDAPVPSASLVLTDTSIDVAGSPMRLPTAHLTLADGVLTLPETTALWRDARATVEARVPLRIGRGQLPSSAQPWLGNAPGPARLEARANDLQPALLEPFVGTAALEGITGSIGLRLALEAAGATIADVTGALTLDEARFTLQGIPLAQARPTVVRLDEGVLTIADAVFSGANTDLVLEGSATLVGEPSLDMQLRGLTDLALLQPFLDGIAPGGQAEIDLRALGPLAAPDLTGQLVLTDASLRVAEPRLVLEQLGGTATFTGRQMALPALRGLANGAPVTISAALALDADNQPGGQLRVRADGVPLEYPEGLRIEADVDLIAGLAGERVDITGSVDILRGVYRDPVALSALSTSLLATDVVAVDALGASAGGYDVRFGIDVESRDEILIDNNYGRLAASVSVRLLGTLESPALSGRVTVREGGELYLAGLTYRVERGAIDFANPARIEPIVDLAAETRAAGERIRIEATGTPDALEVTLSAPESSEPLSQAELASLLVSGRGLDDLSGTAAGEQVLALLSADVFGLIGRGVGLDAIRLDRDLLLDERAGSGEVDVAAETDPVARLTLVKRLRSNVEVLFSQNLRDASAITWLITWKPLRSTELRLLQRDDRSMSYEFRHEVVFGAPPSVPRSREVVPRVASVSVSVGDDQVLSKRLRDRLSLDEGDRFDFYRWQDDRDRLAAWLYRERYFEHRVTARRDVRDGDRGPLVDLTYDIRPGPQGTLEVRGVTFESEVLDRMREAWQGSVFDGFLASDLTRIAREALLAEGHPLPTIDVTSTLEAEGRAKRTTVTVTPGPTLRTAVDAKGVASPLDAEFAAWLDAGAATLAWLDPSALASRARAWLRQRGVLRADVSVSEPEVDGDLARRIVRVDDGEAFTLSGVEVSGTASSRETAARDQLGLSVGDAFDAERIRQATRDLEQWYLAEGFRTVAVETATEIDETAGQVRLAVDVTEGARAVIVATHIDGREHTQQSLLERALALPLGEPATPERLLSARKRLYDTGVVASADVRLDEAGAAEVQPDGTRVQPVAVTGVIRELPRLRLRYGVAVNDDVLQDDVLRATSSRRVTPGLSALLEQRNLFGRAILAGLSARYERARQTGRTFLTSPSLFGLDGRLQASAGIARSRLAPDQTDSPIDLRTDVSLGVTQGLPGLEGLRLTYGYRFERSRTYDPQNPDLFDITITAPRLTSTAYIDRRDDPSAPTRGWFHASTLELSRGWVGSDFEFLKYYAQQSAFRSVGEVVLAGRAQIGLGRGFGGQDLIGSERFSAGGAVSVRGYGEQVIGEVDSILGIARGDGLVVLNGEVRLPIWRWVSGVGFVDAGGVYGAVGDISLGELRWGTGAGVRVSTPAGLVRIDVGLPVSRRAIDKAWRVYVGLGQIF